MPEHLRYNGFIGNKVNTD